MSRSITPSTDIPRISPFHDLEEWARSKEDLPPNWEIYSVASLPELGRKTHLYLKGNVTKLITRGKNKGKFAFSNDPENEKHFIWEFPSP